MAAPAEFKIDLSQEFPHLSAAPIVEAVIHWRARAERAWERDQLRAELGRRLPEYPTVVPQHTVEVELEARLGEEGQPLTTSRRGGWHGFRMVSADKRNIAQFNRDGVIFSRLEPYQDWQTFEAEGRRLWRIFAELAIPSQVERLGVRFINRLSSVTFENLGEYLHDPPTCPLSLPLHGFLYQSTFDVPGHDLAVRVGKAMQPADFGKQAGAGLILDIDVFTMRPVLCDEAVFANLFEKMHWLKNGVFFSLVTPKAIDTFREDRKR